MGRPTAPGSAAAVADHLVKRRNLAWILIPLILLPSILAHVVLWRIEQLLDLKIEQKPYLTFRIGALELGDASLHWKDYLQVRSGSLHVRYGVSGILTGKFPISLEGDELVVTFGPKLRDLVGQNEAVFDHLSAKVMTTASGEIEIEFLKAQSKTLQFNLTKKS